MINREKSIFYTHSRHKVEKIWTEKILARSLNLTVKWQIFWENLVLNEWLSFYLWNMAEKMKTSQHSVRRKSSKSFAFFLRLIVVTIKETLLSTIQNTENRYFENIKFSITSWQLKKMTVLITKSHASKSWFQGLNLHF